jgi:hypothetical protein
MENGNWKDFINQYCLIVFEDMPDHVFSKRGIIKEITTSHIILTNKERNDCTEAILLTKIIRMEVIK